MTRSHAEPDAHPAQTTTLPLPSRYDFAPWLFWNEATEPEREAQQCYQDELAARRDITLEDQTFISPLAAVPREPILPVAVGGETLWVTAVRTPKVTTRWPQADPERQDHRQGETESQGDHESLHITHLTPPATGRP